MTTRSQPKPYLPVNRGRDSWERFYAEALDAGNSPPVARDLADRAQRAHVVHVANTWEGGRFG